MFKEAAFKYLSFGWSVIPVHPKEKTALVQWKEFQFRKATAEEITVWDKAYPDANIGIITGSISDLAVIDLDCYKNKELKPADFARRYPTRLISKTGRGGYHLFYHLGDNTVSNSASKIADGVDIRGNGGYVVVPPSKNKYGEYKWVVQDYEKVGDFPSWIVEDESQHNSSGEQWLHHVILHGVSVGQRNDTIAKLAGYLAGKEIPGDIALALLQTWNKSNAEPIALGELRTTVDSIYEKENKKKKRANHAFDILDLSQYMRLYGFEPVSWTIKDWLPAATILFLIAPPGSYKTWLLCDLAVSIASGTPFLNRYELEESGPVIFIQQEDPHNSLAQRIATVTKARFKYGVEDDLDDDTYEIKFETPPNLPIFFHTQRRLQFGDEEVMKQLEDTIARLKPKLVILDPLYSAADTSDYMTAAPRQMMILKDFRDRYGCSFVIAHHTAKGAGKDVEREKAWGTQFINAFMESGWQIRKDDLPSTIMVHRHSKSHRNPSLIKLQWDIDTDSFPGHYRVSPDVAESSLADAILMYLANQEAATTNDIAESIKKDRTQVSRELSKLEAQGHIMESGKRGREILYRALVNAPDF